MTSIFQVDSFTSDAFAGNPAGVCILADRKSEEWMQAVAAEMGASETAFVRRNGSEFSLRWFTPEVEVELCGHATLATAHVLWETGAAASGQELRFRTASGLLTAARRGEEIELDFPARPPQIADAPTGLLNTLGVDAVGGPAPIYVGRTSDDYLVEVDSEETVRDLRPDFAALRKLPLRAVIVTSRASSGRFDFVSRFFAPSVGVDEDPVTGSAHCCLGPFWGERLGTSELLAFQASKRGGVVSVVLAGDRVRLGGRAVTVMRGELMV